MTLNLEHTLESKLAAAWSRCQWRRDSHVVLAVSGGPDSVAMLRAILKLQKGDPGRGEMHVAHFNHRRRPDAHTDQAWLESLCRKLQVSLLVGTGDVAALAAEQGDGWEAAARSARYEFLRQTAEKLGARFVAVAHTADDQVETVLHRLLRGTGLAGLAGMPFVRPLSPSVTLVRPLLQIRRQEVSAYLAAINQDFRTDASNVDLQYTRNRLRHELLPALRTYYNADVDQALLRVAAQANETQQLIGVLAADLVERCVRMEFPGRILVEDAETRDAQSLMSITAARLEIACRPLAEQPPLLVREVCKRAWTRANWPLQAMGFDEWQQLADRVVLDEAVPPITLPGNIRGRREGDSFILEAVR